MAMAMDLFSRGPPLMRQDERVQPAPVQMSARKRNIWRGSEMLSQDDDEAARDEFE